MAKKTTTAKAKQTVKPHVARNAAKSKRSEQNHPEVETREIERERESERGALIEHFRGERTRGEHTGDTGSLDEETLDRSAPYNRTYGR
jgi:hypothetical protein